MQRFYAIFFLLMLPLLHAGAQTLEGTILEKQTGLPLDGASVYLDGTTIMTITDKDGHFRIVSGSNSKQALIVSFVGYLSVRLQDPFRYPKITMQLEKEVNELQDVVISKGPFSRRQMMEAFRRQFIGTSKSARSCTIENENDIVLYYDTQDNSLTASARTPLRIRNEYLGYDINFDLVEMVVVYKAKTLEPHDILKSYFSGSTFYKDVSQGKDKTLERRKETYQGSASHFMNTLAHEDWQRQKFSLYIGSFQVNPRLYFRTKDTLGIKKVTIIKEPEMMVPPVKTEPKLPLATGIYAQRTTVMVAKVNFQVFYKNANQSAVAFPEKNFLVDDNGNFYPQYGMVVGGYMGSLKAGDLLPTDYYQTLKNSPGN